MNSSGIHTSKPFQAINNRAGNTLLPSCLKWLVFSGILVCFITTLHAQRILPGTSIYQIFGQEMEKYAPSDRDNQKHKPLRSILPSWWNKIPPATADTLYMLGVSDPGLPDSLALSQAVIRAVSIAGITSSCNSALLSDYFINAGNSLPDSKFQEMYRFSSQFPADLKTVVILKSSKLKSGEVIVLCAIPTSRPPGSNHVVKSEGYLFTYEVEISGKNVLVWKYSLSLSSTQTDKIPWMPDTTVFYQVNNQFKGIRNLRKKLGPGKKVYDLYYSPVEKANPPVNSDNFTSSGTGGLWVALVNNIFAQYSFFVKKNTDQTQVVQDQSEKTRYELNREKSVMKLRLKFQQLSMVPSGLMINTSISDEK